MSDQAASTGDLTRTGWRHGTRSSSHTCHDYHAYQPGHGSSRPRHPLPSDPMRQETARSGTSTSEDGTAFHTYEYSWAPPPGHLRLTDAPRDTAHHPTTARIHKKSEKSPQSEPNDNSKLLEWADPGQYKRMEQPQRTPQIRRLRTPDLEPLHDSARFCNCLSCGEVRYQEGRAKMDSQRECMPFSFSALKGGDNMKVV